MKCNDCNTEYENGHDEQDCQSVLAAQVKVLRVKYNELDMVYVASQARNKALAADIEAMCRTTEQLATNVNDGLAEIKRLKALADQRSLLNPVHMAVRQERDDLKVRNERLTEEREDFNLRAGGLQAEVILLKAHLERLTLVVRELAEAGGCPEACNLPPYTHTKHCGIGQLIEKAKAEMNPEVKK